MKCLKYIFFLSLIIKKIYMTSRYELFGALFTCLNLNVKSGKQQSNFTIEKKTNFTWRVENLSSRFSRLWTAKTRLLAQFCVNINLEMCSLRAKGCFLKRSRTLLYSCLSLLFFSSRFFEKLRYNVEWKVFYISLIKKQLASKLELYMNVCFHNTECSIR